LGVGSHIAFRTAPQHWRREQRERRELALRRLTDLTRQAETVRDVQQAETSTWQASNYRHYSVPVGLRLDAARRVIREAREAAANESKG
jgi:hypothetical protein